MPILRSLLGADTGDATSHLPTLTGSTTPTGVAVTPERSLQISAVYACISLISDAISQLPVHIYRARGDERTVLGGHPVLPVIAERANPWMTADELWRQVVAWMLLRGNAFVYVERNGAGMPVALWPIFPTSVVPKRNRRGQLSYQVTLNDFEYVPGLTPNQLQTVPASRMLHFRAFALGLWGLSPVGLARTKIGVNFAAEEYGAGFFRRGANPGGAITTPDKLTDEQYERLRAQWMERHGGFAKSHTPAIFEGGVTWQNIGLAPDDAQFLETMKYTAATIAGHIYRVPPHMIGDTERSTSWGTGIVEQSIGFVRYTLMAWITRLENIARTLLVGNDLYVKFNTAGLERADTKGRYDAYAVGRQNGWLSTNDIRAYEDLPPVDGGDSYWQPLNIVPIGDGGGAPEPARTATREKSLRDQHVAQHERRLRRYFRDQRDEVLELYGTGRALREFDRDESDRKLARLLASLGLGAALDAARTVAEKFGVDLNDEGVLGWMQKMGQHVAPAINDATFEQVAAASSADALREVFDRLITQRAPEIAKTRVAEAFGFGRHDAAEKAGASAKVWIVGSDNPRASHAAMSGERVELGGRFSNGARWPGDSISLPVDEVAGCTCDMIIEK